MISTDIGLLLRAIELATTELGGMPRMVLEAPANPPTSLDDAVTTVRDVTGANVRSQQLSTKALLHLTQRQSAALIPTGDGWLICRGRTLTQIDPHSETNHRVSAQRLRELTGQDVIQAIVIEPLLTLESLSKRALPSTNPWRRLQALIALERPDIATIVVYAVALGGLTLAVPIAVQVLVNTIAFGSLLQPLVVLATLLCGVRIFSSTIQVIEWYAVELMQRRLFVRVSEDFARRLARLPDTVRRDLDVRELVNRFFDVATLQKALGKLLLDGLGLALQTVVGLLLLGFYHPFLLIFDIALILGLIVIFFSGAGAVKSAVKESEAKYRVADWLQRMASPDAENQSPHQPLIRADALTRSYIRARKHHFKHVLRQLIGGLGLRTAAMVALLGLGGWLVMRGELTLGQLVAAELVVGAIGTGFAKIGKHLETTYDLIASLDKICAVVDLPAHETQKEGR